MSNIKVNIPVTEGWSNIQLYNKIAVETFLFPDGQPHVKFEHGVLTNATIDARITNSNDLMNLLLLAEVIGITPQHNPWNINLRISYLMGARMDRRIDNSQPFTLKVIAKLIKDIGFSSITLFDVHSPVATALLDATNILPIKQVHTVMQKHPTATLVAPDLGATKKVETIADKLGMPLLQAVKHRNPNDGNLDYVKILGTVRETTYVIVDDICDGGRTFINLANELKFYGARKVVLYISHGIFSKGYILKGIDEIWTTDSYKDKERYPEHIRVLEAF